MAKSSKKKTTKKKTAKKAAKASSARSAKKSTKKKVAKKATKKKATKKKAAKKKAAKKAPAKKPTAKKKVTKKSVVAPKPKAKSAAKPAAKAKSTKVSQSLSKRKSVPRKPAGPVHGMRAAGSVHVNGTAGVELPFEELTTNQLKRAKSGLKRADLVFFRKELLERRAEILGDVEGLDAARNNFGAETSNMPLHMADVGSENYDREFNLGLLESEKKLLREIDEALLRIVDGTYGVCHATGKPIERIRLEIKPWAKYCIEIARERERRGMPT